MPGCRSATSLIRPVRWSTSRTRIGVVSELGASDASFTQATAALIGDLPLLLVLDNIEHLIEVVAPFVAALLRACPNLIVLATSRRRIDIPSETVLALQPFEVDAAPGPDRTHAEALSLAARYLVDLTRPGSSDALVASDVEAFNTIARRMGGLPLGLEQAAAQLDRFNAQDLVTRLDHFEKQSADGAVGTAIEWSLTLLSHPAAELLAALSHLDGDWTLQRAEAIGSRLGLPSACVVDAVGEIVQHSLANAVRTSASANGRLRIIAPIREYLRRRPAVGNAGQYELACAETIVEEASDAAELLEGRDQRAGVRALRELMPDIRRTIIWCASSGRVLPAARLLAALRGWWWASGTYADGQTLHRLAEPMLGAWEPVTDEEHQWRIRALAARALIRPGFAAPAEHVDTLRGLLDSARVRGTERDISWIAQLLAAGLAFTNADAENALAAAREGLESARRAGDHWLAGWALYASAIACARADPIEGLAFLEQSTAAFVQSGDLLSAARVMMFRAHGLRIFGITESSDDELRRARDWCTELDAAPVTQLDCELGIAQNAHAAGRTAEAAERYRSLVPRLVAFGDLRCAAVAERSLGAILADNGDLDGASALVLHALEMFRSLNVEDTEIASACIVRAEIAVGRRHLEQAAKLIGRARSLASGSGVPLELRELRRLDELADLVRGSIGPEPFNALVTNGMKDSLL